MSDDEPRNPSTRRGFIFGAIIVGALALAVIVIAVTALWGGRSNTASPTPHVTATQPTIAAKEKSICGLPGYDKTATLTVAPATTWTIIGTMAAPSAKNAGPAITTSEGLRICYAHTVKGALFTVANWWAMGSDSRLAQLEVAALIAPGLGRNAAIAAQTSQSSTGIGAQITGFKILSYTSDTATVDMAFQLTDGRLLSFAYPVIWIEGDWKIVVDNAGQPTFRPVFLQSLGGYTVWKGVS